LCDRRRQDLERDLAPQALVPRPVHLAHSSRPEEREDLVGTEPCAGSEAHRVWRILLSAVAYSCAASREVRCVEPSRVCSPFSSSPRCRCGLSHTVSSPWIGSMATKPPRRRSYPSSPGRPEATCSSSTSASPPRRARSNGSARTPASAPPPSTRRPPCRASLRSRRRVHRRPWPGRTRWIPPERPPSTPSATTSTRWIWLRRDSRD
jgi:hypothetical protein